MIFFGGFAVGTFGAGIISDLYGRKSAIMLMAQLLFGCGILTAAMRNMVGFTIMWFFTGRNNYKMLF
jgi:MFS family permease